MKCNKCKIEMEVKREFVQVTDRNLKVEVVNLKCPKCGHAIGFDRASLKNLGPEH